MASTSDVAKRYFNALAAQDLDAAVACWAPGGIDRLVGQEELVAPDGIREYFGALFEAFPDFRFEILDTTTYRNRCAVRWRVRATFAGPGRFQGFIANGARIDIEGCDVVTVADEKIQRNDAYIDSGSIARQLGFLPPAGSRAEAGLAGLANLRTRIVSWIHGRGPEQIADGVWIVRGGFLHLFRRAVPILVVLRGVGVDAPDPRLDQGRTRARPRPLPRSRRSRFEPPGAACPPPSRSSGRSGGPSYRSTW